MNNLSSENQPKNGNNNGSGHGNTGGVTYQSRVAGWVAVRILAEKFAEPSWELPQSSVLDSIRLETDEDVDDLMVITKLADVIYIQVKHGLQYSKTLTSEFASCISQFTRLFLRHAFFNQGTITQPWQRPLDPNKDRLVIVTDSSSSTKVQKAFPTLLNKLRQL
jgi:hypothetical protein